MQREHATPSRRQFVQGAAAVTGGLLAGCSGSEAGGETTTDATESEAQTDAAAGESTSTAPPAREQACLEPAGCYTLDAPPESVFTVLTHHTDMAVALGYGDAINAVYSVDYSDSLLGRFTEPFPGVDVDLSDCFGAWNPGVESLYELDSDIHLADPANVLTMGNWSQSDIEEIEASVAPWFGNTFSDQHRTPPEPYADRYEYYTLWEQFEQVAVLLRERDRYEALAAEYDALRSTIESELPDDRPSVAMVLPSTNSDGMWRYDLNAEGFHASHTRPLGAVDAFADTESVGNGDKIDYEALLDADPEVLLVLGGLVDYHDISAVREKLADDPVASEVTAVQNDRVYAQGTRHQGPLVNLLQIEIGAKQLYPEAFGEWPRYTDGPFPELSADERLFDHQRVGDIVAGTD